MKSEEVLSLLKKIPKGKITTYKELARISNTNPRIISQILKRNKNPRKYTCYKVISSSGYVYGYLGQLSGKGISTKIMLLKKEGIKIKKGRINLSDYMYHFNE